MSTHFGALGIGGSLGKCAVCGESFMADILFGNDVTQFHAGGISQTLYAHKEKCVPLLKECAGDKWRDLPEKSPLRKVFAEHEQRLAASEITGTPV